MTDLEVIRHYADGETWFQSDKAEGVGYDYDETYNRDRANGYDEARKWLEENDAEGK